MLTIRVRSARPDDQAALVELWREVEQLHGRIAPGFFRGGDRGADWRPPELREGALAALAGSLDALLLVAVDDSGHDRRERTAPPDRIVGAVYASVQDAPRSPSLSSCRRLYVETLAVLPSQRRRGVGRRLMVEAERRGQQLGAEQVVLTVWTGNEQASGFYRALGYAAVSQVLARDLP